MEKAVFLGYHATVQASESVLIAEKWFLMQKLSVHQSSPLIQSTDPVHQSSPVIVDCR